jgi:hypothetical protein
VGKRTAQTIVAEIGVERRRFPTAVKVEGWRNVVF